MINFTDLALRIISTVDYDIGKECEFDINEVGDNALVDEVYDLLYDAFKDMK